MRNRHLPAVICVFLMLLTALVLSIHGWLFREMPSLDAIPYLKAYPSVRITDRQGKLLYEILGDEGGRHAVISLDAVPTYLVQATIATEDKNFYEHQGLSLSGIIRAARHDFLKQKNNVPRSSCQAKPGAKKFPGFKKQYG